MIEKWDKFWYVECPVCGEETMQFRTKKEAKDYERTLVERMIRFADMERAAPMGGKRER